MHRAPILVLTALALAAAPAAADPVDDFNTAVNLYKFKRYADAAKAAGEFLAANPDHPKAPLARLYRGQALSELRQYAEARDAFRTFAERHATHPELPLAMYRIGEASFFLSDDAAAERQLTDFLRQYPADELADWGRQYLAETYLRTGRAERALEGFDAVLGRGPEGALQEDAAYGRARALERLNRLAEAAEAYRPLAEGTGSRAAAALFGLGASLFEAGENDAALQAFDQLGERFPGDALAPLAALNAGYAAYRAGRADAAVERFEKAAEDDAQRAAALYWTGLTRKRQGRADEAVEALTKSAEAAPDEDAKSKALYQRAEAKLAAGRREEALGELVDLATRYPAAAAADEALLAAGRAALAMGKLDVAEESARALATRFPDSPLRPRQRLLAARVAVARAEADPADAAAAESAEEALGELIAGGGETAGRARVELARLRRARGEGEQAVTVLRPLLEAGGGVADDARLLAASVLLEGGQSAEALALARRVAGEAGGEVAGPARRLLARAAAAEGRWDEVESTLGPIGEAAAYADAAEAAYGAGKFELAERWFAEAAAGADPRPSVLSGLGYSRYELTRFAEAAEAFGRLQASGAAGPLASNAALMRGLSLEKAGRAEEAGRVYAEAADAFSAGPGPELSGEEAETAYNAYQLALKAARVSKDLGRTAAADGFYEKAAGQLERTPPQRRADLDKLLNEWALTAYEAAGASGDYGRSDELFARLIEQTPQSKFADDARLYLAESAFFGGRPDEARAALAELSAEDGGDPFVRSRAALLLVDLEQEAGDWKAVEEAAGRLLDARPRAADAAYGRFRLGEARLMTGDAAGAAEALDALRQVPGLEGESWRPLAWVLLAEALLNQKKYAEVGAVAEDFAATFPDSEYGYRFDEMRGRALKNQGRFPEARQYLERAVDSRAGRRTETAAKAQLLIAETYALQKRPEEARKEYFKLYTNYAFPEWQAPALFQAAAIDEQLGNKEGAAQFFGTLVEEFPDSEWAAKAAKRLEAL